MITYVLLGVLIVVMAIAVILLEVVADQVRQMNANLRIVNIMMRRMERDRGKGKDFLPDFEA